MSFSLLRSTAFRTAALAGALLLAGCGGGFYVGIDGEDDPDVELAAVPGTVTSGGTVELQASVDGGTGFIVEVRFYRVDGSSLVFLGSDTASPYRLNVTAPTVTSSTTVEYVARAWDEFNNRGESDGVTVTVNP